MVMVQSAPVLDLIPGTVAALGAVAAAVTCGIVGSYCKQPTTGHSPHAETRQQVHSSGCLQPATESMPSSLAAVSGATAKLVHEPEPEPEWSAEPLFVDDAGRELCLKFHGFQRGKCRHGVDCHRSHAAPSPDSLARLRLRQTAEDEADRASTARHAAEARAAWAKPLPVWLHEARSELVFRTDATQSFEHMCAAARVFLAPDIKGCISDGSAVALDQLHAIPPSMHQSPPVCPSLLHAYQLGGHKMPRSWKKALLHKKKLVGRFQRTDAYKAWIAAYRDFVRDVVAPRCGDPRGVVFQCPPTLRIHMPGKVPTIGMHTDSE
eukprot:COSAG02_NODE_6401_length_3598_cov_19.791994_4_plen_322_part_00